MATGGNTRDVELAIGVSTSGTDAISKLEASVKELAAQGGAAAPQFEKLGNELAKIGQQQNALDAFTTVRRDVADLSTALGAAAAEVDRLGAQLPAASQASEIFTLAQKEAADTVKQTAAALAEARAAQVALREEYTGSARRTDEFRVANGELRETIITLSQVLREQKADYKDAAAAARETVSAENALTGTYNQAVAAARSLSSELGRQNTALAESRDAVAAVGLATGSLVEGQQAIRAAFDSTQVAIAAEIAALEKSEATTKALAQAQRLLDTELDISTAGQRAAAAAETQRIQGIQNLTAAIQAQGRATQAALDAAFAQTGVRSAQAIQTELRGIDEALDKIARDSTTSGADFDRAFSASRGKVQALKNELAGLDAPIKQAAVSTNVLGDAVRQLSIYFSAFTIGKEFFDANAQLESLRRTLTIVTGSAEDAGKQIDFLRKTANDSGVAIGSLTGAYGKFASSALASGISLQTVNRTFGDVTKAAGLLGLSSEEVGGALNALGQIASKGKVQMEELGQQLGDRLPAVLATTAKGLNVTTAELTKLITNGEVLGDSNFFNAFSKGIEESFLKGQTSAEGLNASLGRLKNAFNEFFTGTGEQGGNTAVRDLLDGLTTIVQSLGAAIGVAQGSMKTFTTDLLELLTLGDKPDTFSRIADDVAKFDDNLHKSSPTIAYALDLMTNGFSVAQAKAEAFRQEAEKQAAVLAATSDSARQAAAAASDLGNGLGASADATAESTSNYVALQAQYAKVLDSVEKQIVVVTDLAKAKKVENEATLEIVRIGGNEVEMRAASVAAAQSNAEALIAVSTAHQNEVNVIKAKIDALRAEATAHGGVTVAVQAQLTELEQLLKTKTAEAEKTTEATQNALAEAAARQTAADTYKDNSAALGELTKAYQDQKAILEQTITAQKLGLATQADVAAQARETAKAEALYHDALEDTTKALERKVVALKSASEIQIATLNVQKAQLQSEIDIAKANGDEYTVLVKTIEQKELDIKIIQAKIAAQRSEANASIAVAQATLAELDAEGKLTVEKKAQVQATIDAAKVKLLEADASEKGLAALQKQVENLKLYGTEAGNATKANQTLGNSFSSLKGGIDGSAASTALAKIALGQYITETEAAALAQVHLTDSFNSFATAARNAQNFSVLGKNTDANGFSTNDKGETIGAQGQVKLPDGSTFDVGAFNRETQDAARTGGTPPDPNSSRFIKQSPTVGGDIGTAADRATAFEQQKQDLFKTAPGYAAAQAAAAAAAAVTGKTPDDLASLYSSNFSQTDINKAAGTTVNIHLDNVVTTVGVSSVADANKIAGLLATLTETKQRTAA